LAKQKAKIISDTEQLNCLLLSSLLAIQQDVHADASLMNEFSNQGRFRMAAAIFQYRYIILYHNANNCDNAMK
jgi:hypothetical protein